MFTKERSCILGVFTIFIWSGMTVYAQTIPLSANLTTPANTPESAVAAAINPICSSLGQLASLTLDQAQLRAACVQLGSASNDFDERVTGLVAISAKTATAQVTTTTRTSPGDQGNLLGQRLSALRRGLEIQSLSGLNLYLNEQKLAGSSPGMITGGAAGGGALGSETENSAFSAYFNGNITISEQATTANLAGFEADAFSLLGGGDYRFSDKGVAGVALTYLSNDLNLEHNQGQLEGQGYGIIAYGNYFPSSAWFLEGSVYAGSGSYDLSRNIDFMINTRQFTETARSTTDTNQTGLSLGGGYDMQFANGTQIELSGQFSYATSEVDGYKETGGGGFNLNISAQEIEQTLLTLSAQFSKAFSTTRGVFIPIVRASFIADLNADEQKITANFVSDPGSTAFSFNTPSRDSSYLELAAGGSYYFMKGAAIFAQLETLQLIEDYDQLTVSFGYRQDF